MASTLQPVHDYPKLDQAFFGRNGVGLGKAGLYALIWNRAVTVVKEKFDPVAPANGEIQQLYKVGGASGSIDYLLREGRRLGLLGANPQTELWGRTAEELGHELEQKGERLTREISRHLTTDSPVSDLRRKLTDVQHNLRRRSRDGLDELTQVFNSMDEGALRFLSGAATATVESLARGGSTVGVSTDPLENLESIRKHQQEKPDQFGCGLKVPLVGSRLGSC